MKKNSLYQSLLNRLKNKHTKLATRFHKSVKEGDFQKMRYRKRKESIERIKSLEKRIKHLGSESGFKVSLNYKHWAFALAMGVVVSANAQKPKKSFKEKARKSTLTHDTPLAASFGTVTRLGASYLEDFHTGDLDGDGDIDAIYISVYDSPIILFNQGSFVFTEGEIPVNPDEKITGTALGDFDGDGDLDLFVKEGYGTSVSMWLNNGSGGFSLQPASISFGTYNPNDYLVLQNDVFAGNLDGDGDLDLVITLEDTVTYRSYIGVFENVNSAFTQTAFLEGSEPTNPDARFLTAMDVDGDADIDITYMGYVISASRPIQVYENDGLGEFTPTTYDYSTSASLYTETATSIDFDNDGDDDLVSFVLESGLSFQVFPNDGTSLAVGPSNFTDGTITSVSPFSSSSDGEDLFAFDVDGDFVEDVVVNSRDSTWVLISNGDGTFTEQFKSKGQSKPDTLDGDGDADLFFFDGNISTLDNQGGGTFAQNANILTVSTVYEVDLVDIDGDGDLDFVEAGTLKSRWWENDGNGNFNVAQEFEGNTIIQEFADLDADGDPDMLKANGGEGAYPGIDIWDNDGGVLTYSSNVGSGLEVRDMHVAQLDADADLDVVAFMKFSAFKYLRTYSNDGSLSLSPIYNRNLNYSVAEIEVGDMDGDTEIDVIVAYEYYENGVKIFLNDGTGNLSDGGIILPGPGQGLTDVDVADFDGDGDLDVLITRQGGNVVFFNDDGTPGTFPMSTTIPFPDYAYKSFVGDVDNDGDIDIVFGGYGSRPQVWENDGSGNFTFDDYLPVLADEYTKVIFGDVDSDGDQDFAIGGYYAGTKIVFNDASAPTGTTYTDSLALVAIYDAMEGESWTGVSNWKTGDLSTWTGVTLDPGNDNRVEGLALPGAGLTGILPAEVDNLDAMVNMDLSGNSITGLAADFSTMLSVASINLSGNDLDFGDLEPVAENTAINYEDQSPLRGALTPATQQLIPAGQTVELTVSAEGSANSYQWVLDGANVTGATGTTYTVSNIGRDNMGAYSVNVTNSLVPGLTLTTEPLEVLATAVISVEVFEADNTALTENVNAYLFELKDGTADTLNAATQKDVSSTFSFPAVVLGDFIVAVESVIPISIPDPNDDSKLIRNPDAKYLPTYFGNSFESTFADTLFLNNDAGLQILMTEVPPVLTDADGSGLVEGTIEEDFPEDGSRIDARRRAARRKCGLKRRTRSGRPAQDDDEFELIAYGETNQNGEFEYGFLPVGTYRFFVEYPGIPLDKSAFVQFDVGEAGVTDDSFKLAVFATPDGIQIELILGITSEFFTDFSIYPNPTSDLLTIEYDKILGDKLNMEIVNMEGKTFLSRTIRSTENKIQLDTSVLPSGQYLIKFTDEKNPDKGLVYRLIKR
ncbi:MAG: hypothetical protein Tsb0034_27060 [Ekhidna sp.]